MITNFEQLWYFLLIATFAMLGWIIRWSILKIMDTIDSIRNEQKIKDEKYYELYNRLEKALKELESSLSMTQQKCVMLHTPLNDEINEMKKKISVHSKKLNEHDMSITILENNKN